MDRVSIALLSLAVGCVALRTPALIASRCTRSRAAATAGHACTVRAARAGLARAELAIAVEADERAVVAVAAGALGVGAACALDAGGRAVPADGHAVLPW